MKKEIIELMKSDVVDFQSSFEQTFNNQNNTITLALNGNAAIVRLEIDNNLKGKELENELISLINHSILTVSLEIQTKIQIITTKYQNYNFPS